jgi:hypothetical protein
VMGIWRAPIVVHLLSMTRNRVLELRAWINPAPGKIPKLQEYHGVPSGKGRNGSHRLLRVFWKWKVVAKTA